MKIGDLIKIKMKWNSGYEYYLVRVTEIEDIGISGKYKVEYSSRAALFNILITSCSRLISLK